MDTTKKAARELVERMMRETGLDATGLARKAGLAASTLTRFMNNDDISHTLSARTLARLQEATGIRVPVPAALSGRKIPVVGYVGAGEQVFPIPEDGDQPLDEIDGPPGLEDGAVAAIVRGMSMFPAYWDGDALIYTRAAGFDRSECLYNECVVRVVDGPTYIKMVMPGSHEHLFTLTSYNAPPILDAQIEWAAPVKVHDKRRRHRRV
jgi:hypothetical protein